MSLADLTKQQKQYIILGIAGTVFVAILATTGIRLSLASIATAKEELADLTEKIDSADKVLSKRNRAGEDFKRTVSILKDHLSNIPPEKNYYSWATEIIYSNGRKSNLEIESVDEMNTDQRRKAEDSGADVQFESYALRIAARGSYEQVKVFLRNVEEEYPLVRFTGIDISVGNNYDTHKVQLFIQWPFNLGQITKIWDDVESKQMKIAKRDALKAKTEPKPIAKEQEKQAVEPALEVVEPAPVVAVAEPAPEPVVVAPAPKPVPVVEPVPEVVTPAPVVAVAEPEPVVVVPAPKPVPVVEPVPEVVTPAPVVAVAEPEPEPVVVAPAPKPVPVVEPIPEVVTPAPVVAVAEPEPEPVVVAPAPKPVPVVEPIPEVVTPAPVVAVAEPDPVVTPAPIVEATPESEGLDAMLESLVAAEKAEPKPEPAPIVEPVPEVVKPAPVIAVMEPEPIVTPAPNASAPESLDSIQEALAGLEADVPNAEATADMPAEPDVSSTATNKPVDEFGSLLASLGSRGDEVSEPVSEGNTSSDPEELEAFLKQLAEQQEQAAQQPVAVVDEKPIADQPVEISAQYVSNGKSAALLVELLAKDKPETGGTLGSFLNGLVEDIND